MGMGIAARACMSRGISAARLRALRAVAAPGVKRARPLNRLILPGKKKRKKMDVRPGVRDFLRKEYV